MINYIKNHYRPIVLISLIIIILFFGLLLRFSAPTPPLSLPDTQDQTLLYKTPTTKSKYSPPRSVNLQNVTLNNPTAQLSILQLEKIIFDTNNTSSLANYLKFTKPPTTIGETKQSVILYQNNEGTLHFDTQNQYIQFSFNQVATGSGQFQNPQFLLPNLQKTIESSKLYNPQTTFNIESTTYFSAKSEWLTLTTPESADIISLTLTPSINNYPLYLQENSFVEAYYDRQNQLVKLIIRYPILKYTSSKTVNLIDFEQISQKTPDEFFRLYIAPTSSKDFFNQVPDLSSINPNSATVGYFLNQESFDIKPVYILKSNNYIYATIAY